MVRRRGPTSAAATTSGRPSLMVGAIGLHGDLSGPIHRAPDSPDLARGRSRSFISLFILFAQSTEGAALPEYREAASEATDIILKREGNFGDILIVPGA